MTAAWRLTSDWLHSRTRSPNLIVWPAKRYLKFISKALLFGALCILSHIDATKRTNFYILDLQDSTYSLLDCCFGF